MYKSLVKILLNCVNKLFSQTIRDHSISGIDFFEAAQYLINREEEKQRGTRKN